jgi:hypothetical protein
MTEFKVVLRGSFDRPLAELHEEIDEPEKIGAAGVTGFHATRFVKAGSAAEAIAKAEDGVKAELDRTVLLGRPHVAVRFELVRCTKVGMFTSRYPSEGFTFR